MKYQISERVKVDELFRRHFGVCFKEFYDTLSPVLGKLTMDIVLFDDWLHERIGDYEDEGLNMSDAVTKHYGKQANALVESLL